MIKSALLFLAVGWLVGAAAAEPDPERPAIEAVLAHYRTAVSTGDEALFTTTLLDDDIPFFGVGERVDKQGLASSAATHDVAGFRRGVFHSGEKLVQTFDHVEITRDGGLAQVWLHFVTKDRDKDEGGEGWKAIALLKVGGQWKIASEYYTVRPIKAN